MTMLLERAVHTPSNISSANESLPRPRPHGLDRVVTSLSLAMLHWTDRRAARLASTHEERIRRLEVADVVDRREHDAALLAARVY